MNHWLLWGLLGPLAGVSLCGIRDERPGEAQYVRGPDGRVLREYRLDGRGLLHGAEALYFPGGGVSERREWVHGEAVERRAYRPDGRVWLHRCESGPGFAQVERTYDAGGRLVRETRL